MAGKTEWEDTLIKHGIMEAPVEQKDDDDEFLDFLNQEKEDPLAKKSLEELNSLEDDVAEDTLAIFRERRLKELQFKQAREIYGSVPTITQSEWQREVTQITDTFVVVHLFMFSVPDCQFLSQLMESVARKFRACKFVKIVAQDAVPNFPEANVPTILVYRNGSVFKQFVGLLEFGGKKSTADTVEWVLANAGIIMSDIIENPLLKQLKMNINRGVPKSKSEYVGRRANKDSPDTSDDDN